MKQQKGSQIVKEIAILMLIIVTPLVAIGLYEGNYLQIIDYSGRQESVSQLLSATSSSLNNLTGLIELKIDQLLSNQSSRNQTEKEDIKLSLQQMFLNNNELNPLSSYKKLNILNIMVQSAQQPIQSTVKKSIKKGIQWFSKEYELGLNVIEWQADTDLKELGANTILLNLQYFSYDHIDSNIANRLIVEEHYNEYYIQQIIKELRTTSFFSHCKFTNRECALTTFLFLFPQNQANSFLKIQKDIYIFDKIALESIYESLADYLQLWPLLALKLSKVTNRQLSQLYRLLRKQVFLKQAVSILNYLSFAYRPVSNILDQMLEKWQESPQILYNFMLKGKYLSPYIHNQKEDEIVRALIEEIDIFLKEGSFEPKLELYPLTDSRVGKIDLFPNNFKVGVYMPLAIIFVYPLFIKLKDLLAYIFSSLFCKVKPQQILPQKHHLQ